MNPSPSTHGTQLAGILLGIPLDEWVKERRAADKSWAAVAEELATATNQRVVYSREHLRRLFGDSEVAVTAPISGDAA